jgi:hypothetical protein
MVAEYGSALEAASAANPPADIVNEAGKVVPIP